MLMTGFVHHVTNLPNDTSVGSGLSFSSNDTHFWSRPSAGWYKCNVSYNVLTGRVVAGWIVHDHLGCFRFWRSAILGESISVTEAEAKAILMAVQSTRFMGYENVIFESDCNSWV